MKKIIFTSALFILTFLVSCNTSQGINETVITGHVYYLDNNYSAKPVSDALVYAEDLYAQGKTDAQGEYQLTITPETDEISLSLISSKVGFNTNKVTILAKKGSTTEAPDIVLQKQKPDTVITPIDTASTSGAAAHISVAGNPLSHIYIQSSGLGETALFYFKVTDAQGISVDKTHKVTLHFNILNGPDGGEYLFPESMETVNGEAYTTLNSGIIAGPVQIEASADVEGTTIRALPIRIAIYGGLPDEKHFSVASEQLNMAGLVHYGLTNKVTAFVGDKYSNPVAPGTAVYFSSDYAIISGAATTDAMGRASVQLMSAQPLPPDPLNNSFTKITAQTFTDTLGQKTIASQTSVLFSDIIAPIVILPDTFTYNELNQAKYFSYTVSDIWGHPVVGDTQILVSSTDGTVFGDVGIRMQDTQASGSGTTDFGFSWAPGDSLKAPVVHITITVSSPIGGNGYQSASIVGTKQ